MTSAIAIFVATQLFALVSCVWAACNDDFIEEKMAIMAVSIMVSNCGCATVICKYISTLLK